MGLPTWGFKGDTVQWSIDVGNLQQGACVDLAATVISIVGHGHCMLVSLFPCGTKARIEGLEQVPLDTDMISIYGAVFTGGLIPTFQIFDQSIAMWFPKPTYDDLVQVRELCSGMGVATSGLIQGGFFPRVACDIRDPLLEAYGLFHQEVALVQGDIGDPETIAKVWKAFPRVASILAGFACQPFSRGGAQKGACDARSNTLSSVLHAAFMLRAPIVVLECVTEAGSNNFVIQQLDDFCRQCQFARSEIYLSLEQCWPCKRDRWWTVLTAKLLGKVCLRSFPQIPTPSKLGQIHPKLRIPETELQQLELSPDEYRLVHELVQDPKAMFPLFHGKAPTALHSWGSQLCACKCGCRSNGFSLDSLKNRGLYGVFLPVEGLYSCDTFEMPRLRHPHPTEVACWNCCIPPTTWPIDLRLALAGLGQMAAPLQTAWVVSQIKQHLDCMHFGSSPCLCEQVFDSMRQEVITTVSKINDTDKGGVREFVDFVLPVSPVGSSTESVVAEMAVVEPPIELIDEDFCQRFSSTFPIWAGYPHLGDACSFTLVSEEGKGVLVQLSSTESSVGQVIAAEFGMQPTNGYVSVWDCITQKEIDHSESVSGRSVCIRVEHFVEAFETSMDDWDGYGPGESETESKGIEISPTMPFSIVESDPFEGKLCLESKTDASESVSHTSDPLCKLDDVQLLQVSPPVVSNLDVLPSLLSQRMAVEERLVILEKQGGIWGDDEIRFHIQDFIAQSMKDDVGFLDPLLMAEMLVRPNLFLLKQWWNSHIKLPTVIVGIACVQGHWIPFHCHWTAECMFVVSWDEVANPFPKEVRQFIEVLTNFIGVRTRQIRVEHRRFFSQGMCGVCAIRFIDHQIRGKMLPTSSDEVRTLHDMGRVRFIEFIQKSSTCVRPWLWGAGLDPQSTARLSDLLMQHGVPAQQLDTRIHLIVQTLGVMEVQSALTGTSAWRSLKSLANRHKPVVQLVLPDELNAQVQKKAQEGKLGAKRSQRKGKSTQGNDQQTNAPMLDPAKLVIPKGAFVRCDGQALQQVSLHSIGPFSEGVVLGTVQECHAYMQAGQNINQLSLAFLVLNATENELKTKLAWEQVRVPLRCVVNQEPILVTGFLVHLGSGGVVVAKVEPKVDIEALPACCCKVSVYRDQIEGTWHDFCKGPVKYILGHMTPLECCENPFDECGCSKWHKPDPSPVQEPLLDVWRRQWLSLQYKVVPMDQADLFIVCFRFVASQEISMLQQSGVAGVFLEPRSIDGKEPHLDYQVIWLPNISMAEATRLKQTNPGVLGVARMGSKVGLRVKTCDAPTVGNILKPGSIFLASGNKMDFEMGPLAFGLDRVAIGKLCAAWGWQARPLHTIRVVDGQQGAVWLVQSGVEPPSNIMTTKQGNVVISKIDKKLSAVSKVGSDTVGSSTTIALCRFPVGDKTEAIDPWTVQDPWSGYVNKIAVSSPAPVSKVDPAAALKQVEDRIERAVLAKLPESVHNPPAGDQNMSDASASEARFVALEEQVSRLTQQQGQMDQKMDAASKHQEVQLNQLRLQVSAQLEAQGSQMESLFKQQMSHIEQLLNDRSRSRSRFE